MSALQVKMQVEPVPRAAGRPGDPDADVIHLVQCGEKREALRRLMQRHGVAVYRYVRSVLHDRALAEDIHQMIFIQAYRNLDLFSGRSTLRTWLFALARHRTFDALRRRRNSQHRLDEARLETLPDPCPSAGEWIDDQRLHQALIVCLDRLPELTRTALLLRYQQGFTFEDMAEICGEKPGTMQARVARALPRLRVEIENMVGGQL